MFDGTDAADIQRQLPMVNKSDDYTVTVPADSPVVDMRGKKLTGKYEFQAVEESDDLDKVLESKEWTLADLINEKLQKLAYSRAVQAALAPHKPSKLSVDEAKEKMVRASMAQGVPEALARATVDSMFAQIQK